MPQLREESSHSRQEGPGSRMWRQRGKNLEFLLTCASPRLSGFPEGMTIRTFSEERTWGTRANEAISLACYVRGLLGHLKAPELQVLESNQCHVSLRQDLGARCACFPCKRVGFHIKVSGKEVAEGLWIHVIWLNKYSPEGNGLPTLLTVRVNTGIFLMAESSNKEEGMQGQCRN